MNAETIRFEDTLLLTSTVNTQYISTCTLSCNKDGDCCFRCVGHDPAQPDGS